MEPFGIGPWTFVEYLEIGPAFQKNHLGYYDRGPHKVQFFFNLDLWFRSRCCLNYFLSTAPVAFLFC